MELYFSPLACSMATRIALYEAGAEATFIEVDPRAKLTLPDRQPYRETYSLGLVPLLRTDGGALIRENAAVLQYVADQYPAARLAPQEPLARAHLQQWLHFIGTELHKGLFGILVTDSAPADAKAYAIQLGASRLDYLQEALRERQFLLDHFSVADAYLVTVLTWSLATTLDLKRWPVLAEYLTRLHKRPSVARAIEVERPLYMAERARNRAA